MCGIAGVLLRDTAPVSRESLIAMAGALHHRGPDEHGIYRDLQCGLAHARLSIIVKRLAADLVPPEIVRRPKQPYRAPDALALTGSRDGAAPMWVEEELSARAVAAAGVFDPRAITALWQKCRAARDQGQLSNADNMALVGVVSTQVLHGAFVAKSPSEDHRGPAPRTVIDLVPPP